MKRGSRVGLIVLGFLVLFLLFFVGLLEPWMFELVFHLAVGWSMHVGEVLPKVTVDWSGVGFMVVCVGLAAFIGHRFCIWLWQGTGHADAWKPRWTFAGLGVIVLLFGAGMALTALAHQTGWLLRSPELLVNSSSRASFERSASTSLKTIWSAQMDFASNDRDGNKIRDYWRKDIAGLYALKGETGEALKLIELSVACADAAPVTDLKPYGIPSAKAGYWYKALRFRDETNPDPERFAVLAYPDMGGRFLFIISDKGVIYRKPATEGPLPEVYPDDPVKEGWAQLD